MANPIVNVTEGQLSGKVYKTSTNTNFFSFKGIPYAKPPVGELRFMAPQPPEPWEGVRDGTKDCNICAQLNKETLQVVGDEDCLYLNVSTPSLPKNDIPLLPVMVFIHEGAFLSGNGTEDSIHVPDYLIQKNVVVIFLNYRLGILGFLSLKCKEAPGNMGLKDQVQALKWVKDNIKYFNGDPNNVTIFGISAGGASVEYLLLSVTAKGLFHKAIAQSGSTLQNWDQNNRISDLALKIPLIKKHNVNNNEELLKFLKGLSTDDLIKTSMLVLKKWGGAFYLGFVPTIEEEADWEPFISKSSYDLLSKGEFNKVPFITGYCEREGLLMLAANEIATFERFLKEKNFVSHLPFQLDDTQKVDLQARIKNVYLESENKYNESDSYGIDFFTDLDFLGGIYFAVSLISKHTQVYFYEFAYDGNLNYLKKKLNIDRKGACHNDDGGYLVNSVKSTLLQENISDTDKLVRERMCQMWTNFAKFGNPTPQINDVITTTWEPTTEAGLSCLVIDENLSMKYDMETERSKLFKEFYGKYYK